jgi:hypothetical protein
LNFSITNLVLKRYNIGELKRCKINQGEKMIKSMYLAVCWINPRSGFDLVEMNEIAKSFEEYEINNLPLNCREEAEHKFRSILRRYEGKVIKPLLFEVEEGTTDIIKELKEVLKRNYPDAELVSVLSFNK